MIQAKLFAALVCGIDRNVFCVLCVFVYLMCFVCIVYSMCFAHLVYFMLLRWCIQRVLCARVCE